MSVRQHIKKKRQLLTVLLIAFLLTETVYPVSDILASENTSEILDNSDEETYSETRELSSAKDLELLSEKSIDEGYTKNVRYVLKNDIDLSGSSFQPVSIFAGVLEGKGHSISGFTFNGSQDKTGLIRTVAESGHIRDLSVEADIEPEGSMSEIGGIAGVNFGVIEDCSFKGIILASDTAGGIAGRNAESGIIKGSVNHAVINGTKDTGGIAGKNEGLIDSCENKGSINAERRTAHEMNGERENEDDEGSGLDKLIPDSMDLKDEDILEKYDSGLKINHTGGIAGECSGSISGSVNSGTVGYPHAGYRTGGICGYDRGIIYGCKNSGNVYGRKDIGGITGQYEPYAINAYSEDSLSKTGDSLNELSDRADKLHRDFGAEDDKTQGNIDAIRASSDELRQLIKDYKEYYRCKDDSVEREIREKSDNIRSITDSIELKKYDKETKYALQALIDNSDEVSRLISSAEELQAAGLSPDMINYLSKLSSIAETNNAAVDTLLDKAIRVNKDGKKIQDKLEKLRDASNDLDDYIRGCIDDYKKDLRITSDDIESHTDKIADQMDVLSDALKDSDGVIRKDVDSLVSSLNGLNTNIADSYNEIQEELQKIYDTDDRKDIFDDISDDDSTELKKGVLLSSVNDGNIEADINGGGIAGVITDASDTDSEFEVVSQGQISLNYNRFEKATIIGCKNNGDVTVRNDCAGGIVGRADLGAVIGSDNYGRIESEDGSYAGGIAGRSASVIRGCHSMCEAVSSSYAGGIAGLAHTMTANVCLSAVQPDMEYHGAIAGDTDNADLDRKDKGTVSGNIFVYRGLGAVNGITDADEARAVSYPELLKTEGVPDDFSKMTVTFKAEGVTVKRMKVPYGGSVNESDYPEIEENDDGRFGYWEDKDLSKVEQNITVNAVYVDYTTSIAAGPSEKPDMILNGRFYDGTSLEYTSNDMDMEVPAGNRVYRELTFSAYNEYGIPDNKGYTVRYRAEDTDKDDVVLIKKDGKYTVSESRWDGDYIVFPVDDFGSFYLAHPKNERLRLILICVLTGVIILAAVLFLISGFRKERRSKANGRKQ